MYTTNNIFRLALFLLALAFGSSAWALDLQEAKAQGLVGETPGGYLAIVKGSGEVKALVDSVNKERRARYLEIARRNGTQLSAVEKLAGKKAIEKTEAGHYIQLPTGEWVRK